MERAVEEVPALVERQGELWVVYKPAGWVVHAAEAGEQYDVQVWLTEAFALARAPSPIHRLDRETSGVVLYAGDERVAREVGYYFAQGTITKRYKALVYGRTPASGVIEAALEDGRRGKPLEAVTRYERLELMPGGLTLLSVVPETGRKHQIRRHLRGIGHPIVDDLRYKTRMTRRLDGSPGRVWLHAGRLELPDGRVFEAPLAADLAAHLEALRGP
jgi:23S rRNA-/tRNA-specific pseudouridylate synthase